MSHNVKLKDLAFTDIAVVRAAVKELAREGSPIQLIEGTEVTMRGWRGAQAKVDACIRIENSQYDVGLQWNAEKKQYDVITESMMRGELSGGMGAAATSKTIGGNSCTVDWNAMVLGRLHQRYNIIRDEITAARNGMMTKRVNDPATGIMQLEVEVR